ncbi:MAG TPA: Gfo/Idh/MocA family oxidoreductase [Bryobacteraceae bacterium]|jgi:predicted dehydrogenase|nr:Gfo/Idh/MocA family oxidoreductase [Bryobacteraceae bacterium]
MKPSIALIGLGAVVRNIHYPAYMSLPEGVRVVGGCDPDRAARDYAHSKWALAVFEDPRSMIEATRPDIVAICTPPWLHREQVLLALEHGCHVFCEKPLAESLAEADEMIEAADRAGRVVVVNSQFPSMNIHRAAKEAIGSPGFGRLLHLHVWHTMRTDAHTEAGWRGELARRLCFEFGIHVFELVRFLFEDNPVRIIAHMPNPGGRSKSDPINIISLEFPDGRAASIVMDRLSRGPERYLDMRLDGEFAAIHTSIGGRVRFEAGMHTRERRPFLNFRFVKGGQAVLQDGNRETVLATDGINPFASATARHFGGFLQALRDGSEPRAGIRDNRNTLALVMAAYDSATSGEWVRMSQYARERAGV